MTTFIALLRAVNVGGRKVEMAALRTVAQKAGFKDVQTYIASGNLVFRATGAASTVQARLEADIRAAFGIEVPVILRTADQWPDYLAGNPFPEAQPPFVYLCLSQGKPHKQAAQNAVAKGVAGEEAKLVGDALWIHYPAGMGPSKVTPAHIDKAMGSPTTARNWNTVRKLGELATATG